MADRLNFSGEAEEILSALRFETRLDKAVLARIAFVLSLVQDGKNVPDSFNFSGGEMKRPTFFGSDELFIRTLLAHVYGKGDLPEELLFSNRSLVKNHIDQGSLALEKLYIESGRTAEGLMKRLVELVEFDGRKELRGRGLDIFIGRTLLQKTDLVMEMNNTHQHANSHLAIMGKPGVGKTQFLLKILADIRIQSNYQTHFVYFDYKGDVCIAMLEDLPYNMIVAATNDKPEEWLEDLPLPSHLLCYERFKDPDVIVKHCLKQLKGEGVNAKAGKAFSASSPLVMRIFLSIHDEARSKNLIVANEEDSSLGEDYYDQALLLDLEDEERVELLKRAAEAGFQAAIPEVFEAYYHGWGCEDIGEAADWLVDNNIVPTGEVLLALFNEFLRCVDDELQFKLLSLAPATGYSPALIELAQAYYNGWGVENDPAKALALVEKIDINKLELLERTGGWKSSGIYMGELAHIYFCLAGDYDSGTEKIIEDPSKAKNLYKKALTIYLRLADADLCDSKVAYFFYTFFIVMVMALKKT